MIYQLFAVTCMIVAVLVAALLADLADPWECRPPADLPDHVIVGRCK